MPENTFIEKTGGQGKLFYFIESCGKLLKGQFLGDILFIIKMMIQAIMRFQISSCSQSVNTLGFICETLKGSQDVERLYELPNGRLLNQHIGSPKKRVESSEKSLKKLGLLRSIVSVFVKSVGRLLKQETTLTPKLVPVTVRRAAGDALTLKKFESLMPGERVPVYNLKVKDTNEFVCQGVLVHNCDSLGMANLGANSPGMGGIEQIEENPFYRNRRN